MEILSKAPKNTDLDKYGLKDVTTFWNLSPETLQKLTVEQGMGKETFPNNK